MSRPAGTPVGSQAPTEPGANSTISVEEGGLAPSPPKLNTELGRPPTAGEMDELGHFSVTTYQNYFSLADALRAAGFEPHRNRDLTKVDLVQNIHNIRNEISRVPTAQDIVKSGKHSIRTYIERFGSWNQALREAGYTPNAVQNIHEDEPSVRNQAITRGDKPRSIRRGYG